MNHDGETVHILGMVSKKMNLLLGVGMVRRGLSGGLKQRPAVVEHRLNSETLGPGTILKPFRNDSSSEE